MVALKANSIGESDLSEYLDKESDFAFELAVLKALHMHGFHCEHGGSYDDPVTQKPREFDLRATKRIGRFRIRMAVECKNIRPHFPLLISCLPRLPAEAFHEVICLIPPASFSPGYGDSTPIELMQPPKARRLSSKDSIYRTRGPVDKSAVQVGRKTDNSLSFSDADVYTKWAQALSSAQDLIDRESFDDATSERAAMCYSAIFPLLVVPDGTLWRVRFDANGCKIGKPRKVERCPYFIGKSYAGGVGPLAYPYQISHLEFLTLTGLVNISERLFSKEGIKTIFAL